MGLRPGSPPAPRDHKGPGPAPRSSPAPGKAESSGDGPPSSAPGWLPPNMCFSKAQGPGVPPQLGFPALHTTTPSCLSSPPRIRRGQLDPGKGLPGRNSARGGSASVHSLGLPQSPSTHSPSAHARWGTTTVTGGRGLRLPGVGVSWGAALPLSAPTTPIPGLRPGGGSPGSGGVKGPRAPGSFGEDTVAGLQEASQDPQLTGTATHWGTVWHGGAPEGLVQTDWRTRDSGPSRAAWQEQRPPPSLYFSPQPLHDPLGVPVSLRAGASWGKARAEKGTPGQDRTPQPASPHLRQPAVGPPRGGQFSSHCSCAGRRGPAWSTASP